MKKVILGVLMALVLGVGGVAQPVMAEGSLGDSELCKNLEDKALREAAGCDTDERLDEFANQIIDVVLSMVGLLAVGVMIYGGSIYLTSNGNAQKLEKAKHAIMYGLIGLVVCLLAFAIVAFVGMAVPS